LAAIFVSILILVGTWRQNSDISHTESNGGRSKENNIAIVDADIWPNANINTTGFVKHFGFSLEYNEELELPKWVYYKLTKEMVKRKVTKRVDNFRADPAVKTQSAIPQDYKYSGFDRGHLCPAGDMKWNKKAMDESFLMSNICPQLHSLNAGQWEQLESKAREWAVQLGEIYIITGPIVNKGYETIGENEVAVPSAFYKLIVYNAKPGLYAISFIMENKALGGNIYNYSVPINEVERQTGIDFFNTLSISNQEILEKYNNTEQWKAF